MKSLVDQVRKRLDIFVVRKPYVYKKKRKEKEEKVEEKEEKRESSDFYVHGLIKWVPPLRHRLIENSLTASTVINNF